MQWSVEGYHLGMTTKLRKPNHEFFTSIGMYHQVSRMYSFSAVILTMILYTGHVLV